MSRPAETRRMMSCIMLALFALTSFGITTTICRTSLEIETPTQSEEFEESLACMSLRRVRMGHQTEAVVYFPNRIFQTGPMRRVAQQRTIIGHRFTNDFLAPIRC